MDTQQRPPLRQSACWLLALALSSSAAKLPSAFVTVAGLRCQGRGNVRRAAGPSSSPSSWSEVLAQMAPEDTARSLSNPSALAVRAWLRRVVVGHGLCPWAEGATSSGALAVVCLAEASEEDVAEKLLAYGRLLARAKPPAGQGGATTICLAPRCKELRSMKVFDRVCRFLDAELDQKLVQLAPFHPKWRFGERGPGLDLPRGGEELDAEGKSLDAADFANRAPVPAFHFLRVSELEAAAAGHPTALEGGPEAASLEVAMRNARYLRSRGADACRADLLACCDEAREMARRIKMSAENE
ncbi:unnamed protein product, partial [Polarella glacialis]